MPISIEMIIKIGRVFPNGGKTGRFIWNWGPSPVTGPKCQLMNNSGEGGGVYRGDRPPARKKTCRWKKESETQNSNNREIFFWCKNWHIVCKEGLGATWICISFFVRAGDLALIHIIYSQKSSLLTLFTPAGGTLCPPPPATYLRITSVSACWKNLTFPNYEFGKGQYPFHPLEFSP